MKCETEMGNFRKHGNDVLEVVGASRAADELFDDKWGTSSAKPSLEDRREWDHILRTSYERRWQIAESLRA